MGGDHMKTALENENIARYLRVYQYYKDLILEGKLPEETKLPSIRKGALQLQVSRTTMENAYLLLAAEGYIISKPQSGYYVTDIAKKKRERQHAMQVERKEAGVVIQYDFVTYRADPESFRFDLWRRYMKSALRQDERLLNYGEPQGEREFREVLCTYLQKERGVICHPDQIVIGAGVQSLLHILCPLIKERRRVVFHNGEFIQGQAIFEDYGFEFAEGNQDPYIYYISPSQMTPWGGSLSVAKRMELIREAQKKDILIIEDDYNSEFRYLQKPASSLQGLAGGQGVVYLGTFSKMLLPSIRMSFMVLPPELLQVYLRRKDWYNQTASKAEQIAIAQFIRDGHLASQVRKSSKIHMAKAMELTEIAEQVLENAGSSWIGESGFHVYIQLKTGYTILEVVQRAKERGLLILPVSGKEKTIVLNCACVPTKEYLPALELLAECL